MLLQIPDFEISTETIYDENLIGHFNKLKTDIKLTKEITFDEETCLSRMALIEKQTKLLITDFNRNLLHLLDLDGNILNLFNPNNGLKRPCGICVLNDPNLTKKYLLEIIHIIKYLFSIQTLILNFNLMIKI